MRRGADGSVFGDSPLGPIGQVIGDAIDVTHILRLIFIPVLCLLPGAWIAFAPRRSSLGPWPRAAIAVALSPIVVVVEYYALRLLGLPFEHAATMLPVINVPALMLVFQAWRSSGPPVEKRNSVWPVVGIIAVIAVCLGCIALPWIVDPVFRRFSWHGLMHTDICYAIARGALIPEEPELAGVPLGYPWFGHIYWAVMAWSAGISPTQIYMATNLVWATATGILCYSACRELGGSVVMALSCPILVALGPNIAGLAGWSIIPPNDNGLCWAILGDLRYAPLLQKFVAFEVMPFGFALLAAIVLTAIVSLNRHSRFAMTLMPVLLVALGGLYPHFLPVAAAVALAVPLIAVFSPSLTCGAYTREFMRTNLALVVLAIVAGGAIIAFFAAHREAAAVMISSPFAVGKKTIAATIALGPFAFAAWALWRAELNCRRGALLVVGAGCIASLALNIGARLSGLLEYKYFMCAELIIAAPALVGFERLAARVSWSRWATIGGSLTALVAVMTVYSLNRLPHFGAIEPKAHTEGFFLSLDDGESDADWTTAVRRKTPPDTILVVDHPDVHVSAFSERPLWVGSEHGVKHCGYNMTTRENLLEHRGYGGTLLNLRLLQIESIYRDSNPNCDATWSALCALRRPIALAFDANHRSTFIKWLGDHHLGELISESTGGRSVWLIKPTGI